MRKCGATHEGFTCTLESGHNTCHAAWKDGVLLAVWFDPITGALLRAIRVEGLKRRRIEYADGVVMTHEEATLAHALYRWWGVGL